MRTTRSTERGQAIVLIVLGMVALLGFTALAVDGSMVYADRRHGQSSADAASMAGVTEAAKIVNSAHLSAGNWNCSSSDMLAVVTATRRAAIRRAGANDHTLDGDLSDHHGVNVACNQTGKYLDVEVQVTQQTRTAFMQLVNRNGLTNTVTAVARLYPGVAEANNYTILTTNTANCSHFNNGALFTNEATGYRYIYVCGGGVFANGCLGGDGAFDLYVRQPNSSGGCNSSSPALTNGVLYAGQYNKTLSLFAPGGEPGVSPADVFAWETSAEPQGLTEDGLKVRAFPSAAGADARLDCGVFPTPIKKPPLPSDLCTLNFSPAQICARHGANQVSGSAWSNTNTTLSSGLYCVSGDVTLDADHTLKVATNAGVTIVFLNGGLECNGCLLQLASPPVGSGAGPSEEGLLFYSLSNTNPRTTWLISPKTGSYLKGSMFVPYADVTFETKATGITYTTQVCAYNFHDQGTKTSTYTWNEAYRYRHPPTVELNQ